MRRDDRLAALALLTGEIVDCCRCPRLVAWREQVAREKRAAFAGEVYWGRPVPGFGDPDAEVFVLGLAPAAHGGNRTGRVFTGDRSGDFLFASLHRTGFASRPTSTHAGDGLRLRGAYVAAAVRCAPPANRPTPGERDACSSYLLRELTVLEGVRVIVPLGRFAYDSAWRALREMGELGALGEMGEALPRSRPRFGHGVEVAAGSRVVVCSYHPSQQNTFTGRLTEAMLDAVFARARELAH